MNTSFLGRENQIHGITPVRRDLPNGARSAGTSLTQSLAGRIPLGVSSSCLEFIEQVASHSEIVRSSP